MLPAGSNILTFNIADCDWELGLLSWKEKGVAALQGEGGGVWVSLLLFGREKEERFPVVAVAATAVTQRRTDGRAAGNRLEGGRPCSPLAFPAAFVERFQILFVVSSTDNCREGGKKC